MVDFSEYTRIGLQEYIIEQYDRAEQADNRYGNRRRIRNAALKIVREEFERREYTKTEIDEMMEEAVDMAALYGFQIY